MFKFMLGLGWRKIRLSRALETKVNYNVIRMKILYKLPFIFLGPDNN